MAGIDEDDGRRLRPAGAETPPNAMNPRMTSRNAVRKRPEKNSNLLFTFPLRRRVGTLNISQASSRTPSRLVSHHHRALNSAAADTALLFCETCCGVWALQQPFLLSLHLLEMCRHHMN